MRKTSKRAVAIVAATAMLISLLSGCGARDSRGGTSTSTTEVTTTTPVTTTEVTTTEPTTTEPTVTTEEKKTTQTTEQTSTEATTKTEKKNSGTKDTKSSTKTVQSSNSSSGNNNKQSTVVSKASTKANTTATTTTTTTVAETTSSTTEASTSTEPTTTVDTTTESTSATTTEPTTTVESTSTETEPTTSTTTETEATTTTTEETTSTTPETETTTETTTTEPVSTTTIIDPRTYDWGDKTGFILEGLTPNNSYSFSLATYSDAKKGIFDYSYIQQIDPIFDNYNYLLVQEDPFYANDFEPTMINFYAVYDNYVVHFERSRSSSSKSITYSIFNYSTKGEFLYCCFGDMSEYLIDVEVFKAVLGFNDPTSAATIDEVLSVIRYVDSFNDGRIGYNYILYPVNAESNVLICEYNNFRVACPVINDSNDHYYTIHEYKSVIFNKTEYTVSIDQNDGMPHFTIVDETDGNGVIHHILRPVEDAKTPSNPVEDGNVNIDETTKDPVSEDEPKELEPVATDEQSETTAEPEANNDSKSDEEKEDVDKKVEENAELEEVIDNSTTTD